MRVGVIDGERTAQTDGEEEHDEERQIEEIREQMNHLHASWHDRWREYSTDIW